MNAILILGNRLDAFPFIFTHSMHKFIFNGINLNELYVVSMRILSSLLSIMRTAAGSIEIAPFECCWRVLSVVIGHQAMHFKLSGNVQTKGHTPQLQPALRSAS